MCNISRLIQTLNVTAFWLLSDIVDTPVQEQVRYMPTIIFSNPHIAPSQRGPKGEHSFRVWIVVSCVAMAVQFVRGIFFMTNLVRMGHMIMRASACERVCRTGWEGGCCHSCACLWQVDAANALHSTITKRLGPFPIMFAVMCCFGHFLSADTHGGHDTLLSVRAPLHFFESNPSGRILNRFRFV